MRWRGAFLPLLLAVWLGAFPAALAAGLPAYPPAALTTGGPRVTADAAILIDAATGRTLWSRHADQARAPASTTKMMTALIALERGDLQQEVVVSPAAAATPGSSAGLRAGDRYTLAALLRGLLLRSGNDAAVAIAQAVSGSVPAFAALMNARAQALGLQNTHFVNPHGLTEALHYSSARDLALIARAGLRLPAFAALVNSAEAHLVGTNRLRQEIRRELHNTNRLLLTYDWVDGVKTGTTNAAGNCLVASGTRGGLRLIAVVLHSDDRWGDALRLLQWGYAHFSPVRLTPAAGALASVPVLAAQDPAQRVGVGVGHTVAVPVALDELPRLRERRVLPRSLVAPVRAGQVVGHLSLEVAGETLAEAPLVATGSIPRASAWRLLWRRLTPWGGRALTG